jgi:hypothetical protein
MLMIHRPLKYPLISGSKEGQDLMVLTLLGRKGFFLDVGCGPPEHTNNTFTLEQCGWTGILLDYDQDYVMQCRRKRRSSIFRVDCGNYTRQEWLDLLESQESPHIIDYISVDVDDANIGFIRNFPFDQYEFKIMTYETDCYQCGNHRKDAAYTVLSTMPQYALLVEDVLLEPNGRVWEDWWVNERYLYCKGLYAKKVWWKTFVDAIKKS